MTQTEQQIGYDLPHEQKRNGRETYGRVTSKHKNGDVLQITGAVKTAVKKALDKKGCLTREQAEAIRFYQAQAVGMTSLQSVRMSKIRVDGGKIDMGAGIIKQAKAAQFWRESRMMVPAVVYTKRDDTMTRPRDVYDKLMIDPEHPIYKLGAIYRPDLTGRTAQNEQGYAAIKFIGECVEGICRDHREMLHRYYTHDEG